MIIKAICVMCRGELPEFDSDNPPKEIFCRGCGAKRNAIYILNDYGEVDNETS